MKTLPPCDHDECPQTRCIQNADAKGVGFGDGLGACVEFIKAKLAKAEMTLATREAMEKCWREGTDESWRAAGCHMSKSARLEASARHGRIAVKNREEVAMFKAILHQLAPNTELCHADKPKTI